MWTCSCGNQIWTDMAHQYIDMSCDQLGLWAKMELWLVVVTWQCGRSRVRLANFRNDDRKSSHPYYCFIVSQIIRPSKVLELLSVSNFSVIYCVFSFTSKLQKYSAVLPQYLCFSTSAEPHYLKSASEQCISQLFPSSSSLRKVLQSSARPPVFQLSCKCNLALDYITWSYVPWL